MNDLKTRINQAIADKGCTLSELARAAEVKPPSVADWMNGKTKKLKAATAFRAAAFLGVSYLWLTEGTGPMKPIKAESAAAEQAGGESSGSGRVVAPITHEDQAIAEVMRLMARMNDLGKGVIVDTATAIVKSHPAEPVKKIRRA